MKNLHEALKSGTVIVTFQKVDGSIREMVCTLDSSVLPKVYGDSVSKPGIITVWDIEKEAWRAFREDSIIEWQKIGLEKSL